MYLTHFRMLPSDGLDGTLMNMHAEVVPIDCGVETALVHMILDHLDLAVGGRASRRPDRCWEHSIELIDTLMRRGDLLRQNGIVAVVGEGVENFRASA